MDGPASIILWPCLSTPSMSGGASSGMSPQTDARLSGSGRSSEVSWTHSHHSDHVALPHGPESSLCWAPERTAPGMRERRLGFLFWGSGSRPFFRQTS